MKRIIIHYVPRYIYIAMCMPEYTMYTRNIHPYVHPYTRHTHIGHQTYTRTQARTYTYTYTHIPTYLPTYTQIPTYLPRGSGTIFSGGGGGMLTCLVIAKI